MFIQVDIKITPEQMETIKTTVAEETAKMLENPKALKEVIKQTVVSQVKQQVNEILQSKNFRGTILSKTDEILSQFLAEL